MKNIVFFKAEIKLLPASVITILIAILMVFIIRIIIKRKQISYFKKEIERLDVEKNKMESAPITSELEKVETIIKNDKMGERYKKWQEEFEFIRKNRIEKINDMIIELDIFIDKKDYDSYMRRLAETELEVYKGKKQIDTLLKEIEEINLSEEKYRHIITKLKSKYRKLEKNFEEHKEEYEEIQEAIELQFENIEKRFQDFEEYMEKNEYNEVFHIVKAIDSMIDHMDIVIKEVPDLVLLAKKLIPKKIEQVTEIYEDMVEKEYPLGYLKIDYNVEESLKNVNKIIDRIKVLNLEDCMFELKTMLEYIETLFLEFEKEKTARKEYETEQENFAKKLEKTNHFVADIYGQLDEIKSMYDLTDKDVQIIDDVNDRLQKLNKRHQKNARNIKNKKIPYSEAEKELENLTLDLKILEDDLDVSLKSLGNMYEDEVRAREQLDEIQELLKQSKIKIRSYKLPIISNYYFVELQEANEAILEIIKELEKKPISIRTLNTRVDTARDLVLKLYNTTNEMIKTARLAEYSIIYGNRYRSQDINIDSGLKNSEMLFYKGNYKKSLEVATKTIERVDSNIMERVRESYEKSKE